MKNCDIFLVFAQNIDCGYSLEPPQCFKAKKRKMYIPVNPSFTIRNWGVKVYLSNGRVILVTIPGLVVG